jgi:hypothetical protein
MTIGARKERESSKSCFPSPFYTVRKDKFPAGI